MTTMVLFFSSLVRRSTGTTESTTSFESWIFSSFDESSFQSGSSVRFVANIETSCLSKSANESVRTDSSGNRATTSRVANRGSAAIRSSMTANRWDLPIPRGPKKRKWCLDFLSAALRRWSSVSSKMASRPTVNCSRRKRDDMLGR